MSTRTSKATPRSKPQSVDDYIRSCAPDVQPILTQLRDALRQALPEDAVEKISYAIPAFSVEGSIAIFYAAFKSHIGLYPPIHGNPTLERQLEPYRGEKGNLKFPLGEPLPLKLIARLAALRAQQILDEKKAKKSPRKGA